MILRGFSCAERTFVQQLQARSRSGHVEDVFVPLYCRFHHLSALKSLLELIIQAMHDSRKVGISSSEGDDKPISRCNEVLHLLLAASSRQSTECCQAR